MLGAICRTKIEGFVDGYRFAAERMTVPGRKCFPGNEDIDWIADNFGDYMWKHPELNDVNYSAVLKAYIDAKWHCTAS